MKLKNERHELFAQGLAAGKSQAQSHADAGYSGCRQSAPRLSAHAGIRQRVQGLTEQPQRPIKIEGRDPKTGRFLAGNNGGGRKLGSRNKLATEFIDDLYAKWSKHGKDVLDRVIKDDPAAFMRTVAQILPKELDATLNVNVGLFAEARNFAEAYRIARDYIGADPPLIGGEIESDD